MLEEATRERERESKGNLMNEMKRKEKEEQKRKVVSGVSLSSFIIYGNKPSRQRHSVYSINFINATNRVHLNKITHFQILFSFSFSLFYFFFG